MEEIDRTAPTEGGLAQDVVLRIETRTADAGDRRFEMLEQHDVAQFRPHRPVGPAVQT